MKRSEGHGRFGRFASASGFPPPGGPLPPPGGPLPPSGGPAPLPPPGMPPPMKGPPGCCPQRGRLLGPGFLLFSPLRKARTWLHPMVLLIVCVAIVSVEGRGIDATKWARLSSSAGFWGACTLIYSGSLSSCSDWIPVCGVN